MSGNAPEKIGNRGIIPVTRAPHSPVKSADTRSKHPKTPRQKNPTGKKSWNGQSRAPKTILKTKIDYQNGITTPENPHTSQIPGS